MSHGTHHRDLWAAVHEARKNLLSDLSALSPGQWRQQSLCGRWNVEHVVAHLTAVASVGRLRWLTSIVAAAAGPALALVMTLAGRSTYLDQLVGPGSELLQRRLA